MSGADLDVIPAGTLLQEDEGRVVSVFLRRHSRVLIFVGALVVFVTFVVREGLRENLKDLVDSIDTAQGVFVVEQENQQMSERLAAIFNINEAMYSNINKLRTGGALLAIDETAIGLHYQLTYDVLQRLDNEYAAAKRLLNKVPHDKKYDIEVNELKWRSDDASDSFKSFRPAGTGSSQQQFMDSFGVIQGIEHRALDVETDFQSLATTVLRESMDKKEKDDGYFRIATWASYGLYAVGWGLGLIGKLYGVDGVGDSVS